MLVAIFVAIIAAGIAFLRPQKAAFANLDIQLNGSNVSIIVPHCDMSGLQDKFFLRIYPSTAKDGDDAQYIGQNFDLTSEPRRASASGSGQCVVERPIDIPDARKVEIGQFYLPGGRCCSILWSRTLFVKK